MEQYILKFMVAACQNQVDIILFEDVMATLNHSQLQLFILYIQQLS